MKNRKNETPDSHMNGREDGLPRRQLLQRGAGAVAGLALSGLPTAPASAQSGSADPILTVTGVRRWFNTGAGMRPLWPGNEVVGPIEGPETFFWMWRDISAATTNQHYIYLLGWWLTDDFPIQEGNTTTINRLFSAASRRTVQMRAMLWAQWLNKKATLFRRPGCKKVAPAGQFEAGGRVPVTYRP